MLPDVECFQGVVWRRGCMEAVLPGWGEEVEAAGVETVYYNKEKTRSSGDKTTDREGPIVSTE